MTMNMMENDEKDENKNDNDDDDEERLKVIVCDGVLLNSCCSKEWQLYINFFHNIIFIHKKAFWMFSLIFFCFSLSGLFFNEGVKTMIHTPSTASSSLSLDVNQYWHNVIKERDSSSKIVIEYTLKIFNTLRSQL